MTATGTILLSLLALTAAAPDRMAREALYSAPLITAPLAPIRLVEQEHVNVNPQYTFGYSISDATTGDSKTRQESRDGDVVTGSYSVADPDGRIRTVTYTADSIHGFVAKVTYDGQDGPVAIPFHHVPGPVAPAFVPVQAPLPALPALPAVEQPAPVLAPVPIPAPTQDLDVIIARDQEKKNVETKAAPALAPVRTFTALRAVPHTFHQLEDSSIHQSGNQAVHHILPQLRAVQATPLSVLPLHSVHANHLQAVHDDHLQRAVQDSSLQQRVHTVHTPTVFHQLNPEVSLHSLHGLHGRHGLHGLHSNPQLSLNSARQQFPFQVLQSSNGAFQRIHNLVPTNNNVFRSIHHELQPLHQELHEIQPFHQELRAVQPVHQELHEVQPFHQELQAFPQGFRVVQPFHQQLHAVHPVHQGLHALHPFPQEHLAIQPVHQEVLAAQPIQQEVHQEESQELPGGVISARTQSATEEEAEVKAAQPAQPTPQPLLAHSVLAHPQQQFVFRQPQHLFHTPQHLDLSQFRFLGNGRIV